jgi:YjbE family integral membrane protein
VEFASPQFWVAAFEIVVINILLSGDNAVVIALACRSLEPKDQKRAFIIGCAGIVVLMTLLTSCAALLMTLPYIQIVGCVLLLWIGVKLLLPEDDGGDVKQTASFWGAVKTIIIADIVMSMDNVLGMAGAAQGHLGMLFLGLVITMPLILFGSAALVKLMERFPSFVTIGAGVLGYVAGDMAIGDPAVKTYVDTHVHFLELLAPIVGALFVIAAGKLLARRRHPDDGEPGAVVVHEDATRAEHAV